MSCKKENEQPAGVTAVLHFSPEGMEYIQLNVGRYFIYKDSVAGQEDSVVAMTRLLQTNNFSPSYTDNSGLWAGSYPSFYYDIFTLILTEPANSDNVWFFGKTWDYDKAMVLSSNGSANIIFEDMNNKDLNGNVIPVFSFPVDNITSFYRGDVTVEGNTYTDVIKTFGYIFYGEGSPDNKSETLYWAKGVGIIKCQKTSGKDVQTFTLLRHG